MFRNIIFRHSMQGQEECFQGKFEIVAQGFEMYNNLCNTVVIEKYSFKQIFQYCVL